MLYALKMQDRKMEYQKERSLKSIGLEMYTCGRLYMSW